MFEVMVEADVLERLAARLDVWSADLTGPEWAHLVGLLGLGSTALAGALDRSDDRPPAVAVDLAAMSSPGFADALSPAADALSRQPLAERPVVIAYGPEPDHWRITSMGSRHGTV
jgi:hypothetical protein